MEGKRYLSLEDFSHSYRHPCIIDIKMGFTTIYPWATDAYKVKNVNKDAATTQGSIGFRISGLQVWQQKDDDSGEGNYFRSGRSWGKSLTKETISSAFERFTSGNGLSYESILLDESKGAIRQLRELREWAWSQRSFQFFQSSILIIYEGDARSTDEARVQVRFIDFAHCFRSNDERDDNLLRAIDSLIERILDQKA